MTFFAQHSAADLWLERHLVVLAAMVANYLKSCWGVFAHRHLFRAALWTPLWRHHVALVKKLLIFFAKNKDLSALNTRNFDIRHGVTSDP